MSLLLQAAWCPFFTPATHPQSHSPQSPGETQPRISSHCAFSEYCIFRTIRRTPPQIWEEKGGVSYSLNVAYVYIGEMLCY